MLPIIEKLIISVFISCIVAFVFFLVLQYVLFVAAFLVNLIGLPALATWLRDKAYGIQSRIIQTFNFILRK